MPVPVIYPKVSLEESQGRIARWLVAEGDTVTAGQVLFEIDNDKAAVEVESPAAGVMTGLAAEGALVDVGAEVARILAAGETAVAAVASPVAGTRTMPQPVAVTAVPRSRAPNPTPLARRIARERGITLDGLAGTGPRGRVQKVDVLARLSSPPVAANRLNGAWLRKGEGCPVVLLHGFASDLNTWRGLFGGTRPDWPVLALDLPAHGGSPRDVPDSLDAIAAAVESTLAAAGVGPCVLAGHSFGGAVAARVAARGRVAVRALGLFAPAGLGPQIDHDFLQGILRARSDTSLRPWLQMLAHDPAVISEAFLRAVVAARADDGLTRAMEGFAARFFPDGTQGVSIRADLAALAVPVKVIFGRQDRILPFDATRGLPGNVALHALDNCGHLPMLEHPGLSLRLLSELARSAE